MTDHAIPPRDLPPARTPPPPPHPVGARVYLYGDRSEVWAIGAVMSLGGERFYLVALEAEIYAPVTVARAAHDDLTPIGEEVRT